jgi:DUF1365 family protein
MTGNIVQISFGEVRHQRLRPAAHAFRHGVYYLRIPLRSLGAADFPTRFCSRNRFNLLSFCDRDYGDGRQPLHDWIDALLAREGITNADGEIWLQTFPRVLGYGFNPVSFWFCHSKDGALRAVLCDVHNTFGERHYYLLGDGRPLPWGIELAARKVFHVSPFCDIEGGYRFRFLCAERIENGRAAEYNVARIEYDDAHGPDPLLLTSISGKAHALTDRTALRAFVTYPWLTVAVIARIHWHALHLWLRRIPFFSKPAPPQQELTR